MKAKQVPALRCKRGLRPARRGAEPQVVGLTPQTTMKRTADTMKTYILKPYPAVEPEKSARPRRRVAAAAADPAGSSQDPAAAHAAPPSDPPAPTSLAGVSLRSSPPSAPAAGLTVESFPAPVLAAVAAARPALFIGLDVHQDSIAVSLAPGGSTEVRRYGVIGGTLDDMLKLAKKLQAAHPGDTLKPSTASCAPTVTTASWSRRPKSRAPPATA